MKIPEHHRLTLLTMLFVIILFGWLYKQIPSIFTVKKEGREKFEFFSHYVHYFGSDYLLNGVKHVMIAHAGAVEVSLKKDGKFIVYYIRESEVQTRNANDTAFVRIDYEHLYDDLLLQMKK